MGLNFVVRDGERKGDQFRLLPGLTVGRSKGDIALRDPKVSSLHAKIEATDAGTLVLIDSGSSNGLWIDDQQHEKIELKAGQIIKIGGTVLEVLEDFDLDLDESERDTWQGKLWGYLKSVSSKPGPGPQKMATYFEPALELKFTRGPQTGVTWYLGYGPRQVGRASSDLPIDDPSSLDVCFELVPDNDKNVVFTTAHPDRVHLNDRSVESETLRDGDIISFGDNEIRISHKVV